MQLTHLSVVSILAAASGANAFPMPHALPDGFFKLFGFGSASSTKDSTAPVAPAPPAPYNTTGSYNASGNLTSRFHNRAVADVAVVNYNTSSEYNSTGAYNGTSNLTTRSYARRSVPEVAVEYNTTGGCNTTGSPNATGEYNATGNLATRFHARRSFFPHFGVVNYNATGSYNATGEARGIAARSVAGAVAEVDSAVAAGSCSYPAQYTLTHFSSFAPGSNASSSYVSFAYSDDATQIQTECSFNASSPSLTAGTHLAPRYPCSNGGVSFIWAPIASSNSSLSSSTAYGKLTLIEETCPDQTTTKFESTGSVVATGLRCAKVNGSNATGVTELSTGTAGTLCSAYGSLVGNFTSLQPSPLE